MPVEKIASGMWKINDSGPCFRWTGIASTFEPDSLEVKRTGFFYDNQITRIELSRKLKGRFLFFNLWDKKNVDAKVFVQCGDTYSKTVQIIK